MERLCEVSAGSRFEIDPLDRSLFYLPGDGCQRLQRVYGYRCGHKFLLNLTDSVSDGFF
jgi:hypothetical protein